MVDFVSSLGHHLGNVEGFEFHEFPSLEQLAVATEQQLREAGFGYRSVLFLLVSIYSSLLVLLQSF